MVADRGFNCNGGSRVATAPFQLQGRLSCCRQGVQLQGCRVALVLQRVDVATRALVLQLQGCRVQLQGCRVALVLQRVLAAIERARRLARESPVAGRT